MGQIAMPHFFAMLAELLILLGRHTQALESIRRILEANETSRDLYFNAELYRLAADCHTALGQREAAKAACEQAIETARSQGAKTFELRAATALGRLWAADGEKARAKSLVQGLCSAFSDAEETVDLVRARECLMQLSFS